MQKWKPSRIKSKLAKTQRQKPPIFIQKETHKTGLLKDILGIVKDLILVLAGGAIAIFGNQLFYEKNKLVDAKVEIKKNAYEDEVPYLRRIVNFTYSYSYTKYYYYHNPEYLTTKGFDSSGKFLNDTTVLRYEDTVQIVVPSFVCDLTIRDNLMNDIKEINNNKSRISLSIYATFQDLDNFIKGIPFPKNIDEEQLRQSEWSYPETHKTFDSLRHKLLVVARSKIENGF